MQNTKQAQNIKQMLDTKQVENIKKDGNADLEVEEYYKAIFDFLKDSIVIADITGKIIYCNPNFFDFSGYSPDEIVGKKYTSLPIFSLKDLPRFVKIFFSVIRGEKIYSYQYNWKDKSGEMKISKADIGPIKRDGRVTGIISILKDITEEKTAEEMLKKSEERLSLALEGSGGGIWDWDIKNNRFYLSGNLIEKSGYSLTDVGNSPEVLLEKIYPDDRINFEKTMMEHISGKTSKFVIEVRFIISSGALRWVIIRGKVLLRDYRGKPLRIAGTIFDITDKKATEEALHLSSLSIDNSNEEIFWVDENSNLVNVNKAACRILGYSREELLKMKVPDIDPIYTNEIWPRHWQEVKSGKVKLFESLQITRSGRTFPVEINVNFIQLNGREYIFAFVKDISERKKKELELKKSEQRYRHLIETMYEGVWQIDTSAKTVFINTRMASMLGYTPDEMIGKSLFDFIGEKDRQKMKKRLAERKKGIKQYNHIVLKKDGSPAYFRLEAMPVYSDDGNFTGSAAYFTDITDRVAMEEDLRLKEAAIEASVNGILILDMDLKILYVNNSCLKIWGHSDKKNITGRYLNELILFNKSIRKIKDEIIKNENLIGEFTGVKKDASHFDIQFSANLVKKENKPAGIMISAADITDRKKDEKRIRYLSFHDSLTGLYNRAYLEEELIRFGTPGKLPLSFIIGDLNSLKLINDSYGHSIGDEMLVCASKILKNCCREEDVIARWGGDEFVILLPQTGRDIAEKIVGRIRKACKRHSCKKIPISFALGCATKRSQSEDIQATIAAAENNMYKRKLLERKSISGSILLSLETALSEKSYEIKEHTERIKKLALKLGKKLHLHNYKLDELALLASLHDIGKVAIPESIVLKDGKLNEKEWELIKKHPEIGHNIAESSPQISHIADAILACHEHWDGSGYPQGLKGEEIPVISRIIHIVDAYDVMRSGRPYKKAMSKAEAIEELKRYSGTQFDARIAEVFISILKSIHTISKK